MRKKLEQRVRLSPNKRSMVLSFAMLSMDFGIIEDGSWRFGSGGQSAYHLLIFLEQHIGHRDDLSCEPTNNFSTTSIFPGSLIIAAFDRHQALIDPSPLTIHFNSSPNDQVHHPFHLPRASGRKTGTIQGISRLGQCWRPTEICFQLGGPRKVGNIADHSDDGGSRDRPNAWDRGQDLACTRAMHNLCYLRFQLVEVSVDKIDFSDVDDAAGFCSVGLASLSLALFYRAGPPERYNQQYRRRHKKLTDWGRQMIRQLCWWLPQCQLVVVVDSTYAVLELLACAAKMLQPVAMVTCLRLEEALYDPVPVRKPEITGRPRKKGARRPTLAQRLANPSTVWQRVSVA